MYQCCQPYSFIHINYRNEKVCTQYGNRLIKMETVYAVSWGQNGHHKKYKKDKSRNDNLICVSAIANPPKKLMVNPTG